MTQLTADAGTTYFKIICGLGEVRPDGADGDANPDLMTMSGTVVLSMAADRVRYVDGAGRVRMLVLEATTYTIQASTGELIDPQGNVGVWLMNSASPGVDPSGFTYTATVTPAVGKPWAVTFSGDQTGTLDLVTITNVPSDTGVASLTARVAALEAAPSGGGVTDHGALTGLADDDHPHYLNVARGDARYSQLAHTHDTRYYTESEVDAALAGKAASTHSHPITDVTGLQAALDGKAPASHTHDDRYYTESEVDAALAEKADASHAHGVPLRTVATTAATSITAASGDHSKLIQTTAATAVTVELPAGLPVGTQIEYQASGAGLATFTLGASASWSPAPTPSAVMRAQGSAVAAICVATNAWTLIGDLA